MAIRPVSAEMFDITDCIAVITGGGSGIGSMIAKSLAANGAKVYILGRRLEVLEKAAKEMVKIPPSLQCSVNSTEELQRAVDFIHQTDGRINLLINNAGIATPNLEPHQARPQPKWDIKKVRDFWFSKKFSDYAAVLETNTTAALQTTFAFLELLDKGNKFRERQEAAAKSNGKVFRGPYTYTRSQVLTLSSVGGFGRDNSAFIYGASKAGTTHMMKNLATYLIPWHIRVNVLAPGYFNTDMMGDWYKATGGRLPPTLVPEERFGELHEMGGTVVWLASKAGAYCNGQVVLIDGGYIATHPATY
ncbi:hypothetical protein PRZ48_008319 [Zasmidium cellare]|uniref:Uncharacterized protein n=1 Tax=Zasmidium cellare TaxID=395010 RepID=A0ABR0EG02_ZASCE|nr:hypothetical protein PRZ48_008319 [Zasmidium cellare]